MHQKQGKVLPRTLSPRHLLEATINNDLAILCMQGNTVQCSKNHVWILRIFPSCVFFLRHINISERLVKLCRLGGRLRRSQNVFNRMQASVFAPKVAKSMSLTMSLYINLACLSVCMYSIYVPIFLQNCERRTPQTIYTLF